MSLRFDAAQPLRLINQDRLLVGRRGADGRYRVELQVPQDASGSFPFKLQLDVAEDSLPDCSVAVSTNEDSRWRAIPLSRFYLPWSATSREPMQTTPETARCGNCRRQLGAWASHI